MGIDAGSGYLCQMEPVAHFGLGAEMPVRLELLFPDGRWMSKELTSNDVNRVIKVKHSKSQRSASIPSNNYVSKSRSNIFESPASKIQPVGLNIAFLVMFFVVGFH